MQYAITASGPKIIKCFQGPDLVTIAGLRMATAGAADGRSSLEILRDAGGGGLR